jgi:shikimate kinase
MPVGSSPPAPWLVVLIGPAAVGKMTVGQELSRLTGFPLYHNHLVIDLVTPFFAFGSESFERLMSAYRQQFFDEAGAQRMSVIATWGWKFDMPEDRVTMDGYTAPFRAVGGEVCFVELEAPLAVRLERNRTENRRAHKRTDWATDEALVALMTAHRFNSDGDFPYPDRHLKLDTTNLEPGATARAIVERFGIPVLGAGQAPGLP